MNIVVSACLLGVNCRYDGTGAFHEELKELMKHHTLIPICPEIYGGLATPRDPAERIGEKVITNTGKDVTEQYEKGAREILRLAKLYNCSYAILKERSPSCGKGKIYDGSFTGTIIAGDGVTAKLLSDNGIIVVGEGNIKDVVTRNPN